MALKQVTCSICNQTVLKARTLHIGEGKRACWDHDGVGAKAATVQKDLADKHAQGREFPKRNVLNTPYLEQRGPVCSICMCETVHASEVMEASVLVRSKLNLCPMVDDDILIYNLRQLFPGKTSMQVYAGDNITPEEWKKVIPLLKSRFRDLAESFRMCGVCQPCIDKHGLPDLIRRSMEATSKIPLETLYTLGAIIEPAIKEAAMNQPVVEINRG